MLPTDAKGAVSGGADFFRPEKGQNKVLIVGEAVTGYEYWTDDNKVFRSADVFKSTPGIRTREVTDEKTGEKRMKEDKQKFFWAVPVYDYATKSIKVWQISQKKIREALLSLQTNEEWGNPIGRYSITITREGDNLTTTYTVIANPVREKDPVVAEAMKLYGENPIDISALMFGDEGE